MILIMGTPKIVPLILGNPVRYLPCCALTLEDSSSDSDVDSARTPGGLHAKLIGLKVYVGISPESILIRVFVAGSLLEYGSL